MILSELELKQISKQLNNYSLANGELIRNLLDTIKDNQLTIIKIQERLKELEDKESVLRRLDKIEKFIDFLKLK